MDPLDAIRATYFQECDELLASLEEGLLALEVGEGDGETINAVFRAVHSIKGGAGAFGYEELVKFAHVFETTLDLMRSGKLDADPATVKTILRASDVLADHVQAAKGSGTVDDVRAAHMAADLAALTVPGPSQDHFPEDPAAGLPPDTDDWGFAPLKVEFDPGTALPAQSGMDAGSSITPGWRLVMRPTAAMYAKGHDAGLFLRELARLGAAHISLLADDLPSLLDLEPELPVLAWTVELPPVVTEASIREVFDFVGEDCPVELTALTAGVASSAGGSELLSAIEATMAEVPVTSTAKIEERSTRESDKETDMSNRGATSASSAGPTIRVDLGRVDRLIDLVGELVINQAMLAQRVAESEQSKRSSVTMGLNELEQLTREIQDSVMAIRAQPVKSVFQRMPRLVREIAASTGKQVRLVMDGEATEVDKTVIERLSDPITHMLRNAIDHGVETPEERLHAGKPEEGTVHLSAQHRAGRIVLEVSDDGKGINRARVREIAISKGLIDPGATLSDDEIDNIIFLPGFSTAATVSNISGRGVGMDVVKRAIQALGGRISISSRPGKGSTFTLSLPLTLAVLDGMVVSVGDQTLVSPLTAIVETLRPKPSEVRRLGPTGAVLAVRGGHVPVVDIGTVLGLRTSPIDPAEGVVLLVESEGAGRAALVVDEIQGQKQVVIKGLEANYRRVPGIGAATILGDGRVALILDVEGVVKARLQDRPSAWAKAS